MQFQILDSKRYPLHVKNENILLPYWRYEHRATLGWNTKEFIVFIDHGVQSGDSILVEGKAYIEQVIGGHLETIEDDSLHDSLTMFAMDQGFLEVSVPMPRSLY